MYRKTICNLIYINQSQSEDGSPVITTYSKTVKCAVMDSFSLNYYQNQSREMRNSKNLIIPDTDTEDLIIEESRYILEFVEFNSKKYKVKNILLNRNSSLTKILDIEEVINE